jgi:hypothetical protein
MNRRQFTKSTFMASAPLGIPFAGLGTSEKWIIHHVFFWLKKPEDVPVLLDGLKTLADIPMVKKLLIGTSATTEKREVVDNSYHVSELMYFENLEAQREYQNHPIHKKFVKDYEDLFEKVVVYDTQMEMV